MLVFHTKSLVFAHNGSGGFYVRGGFYVEGGGSMFRGWVSMMLQGGWGGSKLGGPLNSLTFQNPNQKFRGGLGGETLSPQEKITLGVIKLTRTVRISLP